MKTFSRSLTLAAALLALSGLLVVPGQAQSKQHKTKTSAKTKTTKAAAQKSEGLWECQHCKEPMSYAEAKKRGLHCCGMKMVKVAQTKHTAPKKG